MQESLRLYYSREIKKGEKIKRKIKKISEFRKIVYSNTSPIKIRRVKR